MEARIKMPWGPGIWPAFWLLGANIDEVPWPQCGEIDIMEYRGQQPNLIHGSVHGPGYSGGNAVTKLFGFEKRSILIPIFTYSQLNGEKIILTIM